MAKAISSEELLLKKRARRRLVGAIALVLIVVVFLPMILDNEPRQMSQDVSIHISGAQNIPGTQQELPSESLEPLRFKPVETEPTAEAPGRDTLAPARQQARAAPEKPVKEVVAKSKSVAVEDGFVVQLGAFSKSANAARLAATVRENRFEAYTEMVTTTQGERTRVRVGPYPTRAAAEDARKLLKRRKLTFGEPTIMRQSE